MKRLVYLLMAVCLLAALVPIAASAHTEDDPLVVDLMAGQTEDIGDVKVWNDAETLYVQFVYTGPECGFLEVHLQVDVGAFSQDILTKKGNPIPGQFEKSHGGGCFTEHTFTYDLAAEGFDCDDNLLIAAHAALGREEAMAIVSGDGNTMVIQRRTGGGDFTPVNASAVLAWEPGPNYPNDGPDDTGWEAWSLWDQRLSINLVPTGADWIWESYRVLDPMYGTVLTFQRTFDIGYPIGGDLLIACDNGYEVFLNGTSVGSHGVIGAWRTSDLKQGSVPQDGWNVVGTYSLLDYLVDGTNTLTIDAANEYFNTDDPPNPYVGSISNNPGACIFAADIDYYADGETAWGCRTGNCYDFDGRNWATHFGYTIQCEMPEVWPVGGTLSVGYEDLPIGGGNDWDYNDFVVDIDTLATFWGTSTDRDLIQMDFTVRPQAKLAGYTHIMHLDADTFACDGTYELYRDGSLVESGAYNDGTGIDVVLVPNTGSAPSVVLLTISFTGDCQFSFPAWDQNLYHGENLFYDPYLHVNNTGEDIHTGDVRMLTVPVDWQWPTPDGTRICVTYPKVTNCTPGPPTFVPYWWTP